MHRGFSGDQEASERLKTRDETRQPISKPESRVPLGIPIV
jgi:hypothetical protein